MSLLVGLGPLLDPAAIMTIAKQLWSARGRLSVRTGGNLPSATELAVALRFYTANEDRIRLERSTTNQQQISAPDAPDATMLARYLSIADAAYAEAETTQAVILGNLGLSPPIVSNLFAEKWSPGYFISRERSSKSLFLAVRGSKEVSDFLTNLSAETEPFLLGHGHQGVVKSAENLHDELRDRLLSTIRVSEVEKLILLGHSLGGAVAAALTMLLRETSASETGAASEVLKNAVCFSFGAPPFVCADTARLSDGHGVTSLVHNLDLVPRLSAASVDRLLVRVSRYDWGRHMSDWVGQTVESVASGFVSEETARGLSETVSRSGTRGLLAASQTIGGAARALGGTSSSGGLWRMAMNATAAVGELVAGGLEQSRRRLDDAEYGFAREFGMDENDVERVLGDAPVEVYVPGDIWLLEREFTDPSEVEAAERLKVGRLVRRGRDTLKDVEVSGWMVHDHDPGVMMAALLGIAETQSRGGMSHDEEGDENSQETQI